MRLSIPPAIALAALSTTALAAGPEAAQPFTARGDAAAVDRSRQCLAQAIYYEARSQSDDGQRAVAQVVLNRVRHPAYPNTVCGVVYQGSARSTGCQFTFTCDGSMYRRAIDPAAWDRAQRIADAALHGDVYRPVGLATNYHTTAINPYWAPTLVPQIVLGAHIFYRRPGFGGSADAFTQAPAADDSDAYMDNYALRPLESPAARAPRSRGSGFAPRVERAVLEIPVVERPVVYRAVAMRSGAAARMTAARPAAATSVRQTPRVVIQNGVRVFRGS